MNLNCKDCSDKLVLQSDRGLVYTGPSIPLLNIETNTSLNTVLVKMLNHLSNDTGNVVEPKEIKTSDIINDAPLSGMFNNNNCISQIQFYNFNYGINPSGEDFILTYDLSSFVQNLNKTFSLSGVNVKVYGQDVSGQTLIANSKSISGGIPIKRGRFPARLEVEVVLSSTCGIVELNKNILLFPNAGQFNAILEVKQSNVDSSTGNFNNILEIITVDISKMKMQIDDMRTFKVAGTNEVPLLSNDKDAVISSLLNKISNLEMRLNKIDR